MLKAEPCEQGESEEVGIEAALMYAFGVGGVHQGAEENVLEKALKERPSSLASFD